MDNIPACHERSFSKRKKLFSFLSKPRSRPSSTTPTTVSSTLSSNSTVAVITDQMSRHGIMTPDDIQLLSKYLAKFQVKLKHRYNLLKHSVLPWFHQQNRYNYEPTLNASFHEQAQSILLRWWRALILRVQHVNYTERSLYFECIVEIIARPEFLDFDFQQSDLEYSDWYRVAEEKDLADRTPLAEYRYLLIATLQYAMDRLNHKAIYSNMISFCAKILALCFVKVPGVASSLCQLLPVKPILMKHLALELDTGQTDDHRQSMEKLFPTFLHPLMRCRLLSFKQHFADQTNRRSVLSSSGNWVRRWQSDDSELFFSFYRHYHVTMHSYAMQLSPAPVPVLHRNSILALTPCYLYLASYVSTKIQALLQLQLYSVTTMNKPLQPTNTTSPSTIQAVLAQQQQQPSLSMMVSSSLLATLPSPTDLHTDTDDALVFVPTDDQPSSFLPTSFLSALIPQQPQSKPSSEPPQPTTKTGKPRPLVLATQRYAECLVWCAVQADHAGLYHDMLNVWIRTMVKTTSLVAVENVFCLLDLLESLLIEYQQLQRATPMPSTASTHKDACPSPSSVDLDWSALDLPFVLHTLRLILLRSDHTIVLLRALVFVYRHFDMFASHLLAELCHHVLLVPCVFERLLFHWGYNVRQFYMRLLVFRLGRLWVPVANIAWNPLLLPLTASASSSSSTLSAGSDSASSSSSMTLHSDHSTARLWDAQISAMCDGCLCWKAWHQQKIHAMDSDQRIALEIHLHLEVLLDSFQSRYQGLAMEKAGVPGRCIGGATTSSTEPSLTRPLASQRVVLSTSSTPSPLPPCIRSPRRFYHMSVPRRLLKSSQWLRRSSPSTNDPSRHDDQDGLPWLPPPGFAPGFMYITCTEPDTSTPDWLPWARAWRYQSSRQVYADKVRPELKDILQEYLQWLGNKKSDPANLSVPDLYLDWPKNWSF